jgi:hypothetical protein
MVYGGDQMGLTGSASSEAMLFITQDVVLIKVVHHRAVYYMFQEFA